jgi:hypothetical protein
MRKNIMTLDIIKAIKQEQYYTFPDTHVVVCCLSLQNGYHVIGKSYCADQDRFDEQLSRHVAREEALNQVWTLEEYAMKRRVINAKDIEEGV